MGRNKAITKEVKEKIRDGYMNGLNDSEVCLFVGISRATLYNYYNLHEKFREECLLLKNNVKMHAKLNVAEAIIKEKKLSVSERYLDRVRMPKQDPAYYPDEAVFVDDIPYDEDEEKFGINS